MSNDNGGRWKPRKTTTVTCPSGQQVEVGRPGPEFNLKASRVARTFTRKRAEEVQRHENESLEEYSLRVISEMSDEEIASITAFAKIFVPAITRLPRLVLNPNPDRDEVGPDDIDGNDFWFLFGYGMNNFMGIKVPVGNAEVEVEDLESFRDESGVSGDGVDGLSVPQVTEPDLADQRSVDSAGV